MCGIFASLRSTLTHAQLEQCFFSIKHRGPEQSNLETIDQKLVFGFHRLGIIHPEHAADQPIIKDDCVLICNGEIYNHHSLGESISGSDCEVIINMYRKFGISNAIRKLEGEYAFLLFDRRLHRLFVARDTFGVRPLFVGTHEDAYYFASELKAIPSHADVTPFPPNTCWDMSVHENSKVIYPSLWKFPTSTLCANDYHQLVRLLFIQAVEKRLESDRPLGCLLSGGLDSSLVTAIVAQRYPQVSTFSIGLENSTDLEHAQKVVDFLGLKNHHSVIFTIEEGLAVVRDVIYHLESYDITTIRASIPQFLLAKYIRERTEIKAILSGEGSDELFAGYQYSKFAPTDVELRQDTKRLLNELYLFDNLRTDRTMAAWGLEVRVPFLDPQLVYTMLEIPVDRFTCRLRIEKKLLRDAFQGFLPDEILYRPKEAFSDAVSSRDTCWYRTLQHEIKSRVPKNWKTKSYAHNPPISEESYYYRSIFEEFFPNRSNVIPHFWMPKWTSETDPSATNLECYKGGYEFSPRSDRVKIIRDIEKKIQDRRP